MSLGFRIANRLLNESYIVPDVLPSQLQRVIESELSSTTPTVEAGDETFVVCFGRGDDDHILASRDEVGKHLSSSCTNFVYPLEIVRRKR